MKNVVLFFLIIFNAISINTFANIYDEQIFIKGKIIDKKTKEPLAFVNIGIEGIVGTTTDYDGTFAITLDIKYADAILNISYVGYEKNFLPIKKFKNKTDVIIELIPKDFKIEEVNVVAKSLYPYTILKNVSNNLSINCLQNSYNYIFDYSAKEYTGVKLLKTRQINVNYYDNLGYLRSTQEEAYKNLGYNFTSSTKDFKPSSIAEGFVNIEEILKSDILKFTGNILDAEQNKDYDLILKDSFYDKDSVWIIYYTCKTPAIQNTNDIFAKTYKGEIMIRKANFSVITNKIEVTASSLSCMGRSFYYDNSKTDYKTENVKYTVTTDYQQQDAITYLKSIASEVTYDMMNNDSKKTEKKKFIETVVIKELKINNLDKITTKQYLDF